MWVHKLSSTRKLMRNGFKPSSYDGGFDHPLPRLVCDREACDSTSIQGRSCIFFWTVLVFFSLFSGPGRRRPGRHHEQQRAVSCIPVAYLLNYTWKCQKRGGKNENKTGRIVETGLGSCWSPSSLLPKLLEAHQGTKRGSPGAIWTQLYIAFI